MHIQLVIFLICGVVAAMITNILLLNFSQSLGIRNKNDITVRWSNQSKPSLGGISFFVVFVFTSLFYSFFPQNEYIFHNKEFIGLFIAGTMAFLMGLADDAYNTKPLIKFGVQIACGIVLIKTDSVIALTQYEWFNNGLTIFWVVLLMNSLNMLDNMDGITGTVVLFIIITCLGSNWLINGINAGFWSLLYCTMIGGLIGFLRYNIHPSKLFMGDAGSQFIGLFVAFITIDDLWMVAATSDYKLWIGAVTVMVCFTAPFSDTLTVVINRLKRGQSPMVGGKDHTTHHLVYAGMNDLKVWYIFLIISILACGFSLTMIFLVTDNLSKLGLVFIAFPIFIFITLFGITLKYKLKK